MKCTQCGAEISGSDLRCPSCGADLVGFAGSIPAEPENLKQFVLTKGSEKTRKEIKSAYIILYVCAAINLVYMLVQRMFPLDGIIFLALAVWLQMTYSRAAAITTLVIAVAEVVVMVLVLGTPGGWLLLIAGIFAVIYTSKAKKEYDAYLAQNQSPQLPPDGV